MLAMSLTAFAIGALLANVASVSVFAVGSLVLAATAFVQAVHVGWPLGQAVLTTVGCFVLGQVGYVAGIGVRALLVARVGRTSNAPPPPGLPSEAELEKPSAAPLGRGR